MATCDCQVCELIVAIAVVARTKGSLEVQPNRCVSSPKRHPEPLSVVHHQRPMLLVLLFLLPSQHVVKHELLGPSVAQGVEAHNMSVVVRQLVVLVAVAAQTWVAALVLVLCWPALSRLLVVPVAAIGSLTVGPMEPMEQHAGVVVVVPWLQHSPAGAQHQRPLCSGAFSRTVPLRGPVRRIHSHV